MVHLSVFQHRFMTIAEQMGRALENTAISTNIKVSAGGNGSGGMRGVVPEQTRGTRVIPITNSWPLHTT